ncbi:glycosyltransferase family protein [Clostridium sp.]|uniref:glycosyltransferase family protein n=1 Tax=Clostridium sp. TaxID=1506 RepID=UPI003217BCD0
MKIVCIMQARVGSSRLPGKVLKNICGKTVLEHDVNRLRLADNINEIVIATTVETQDDKIVDEANRLGVKYFRGSEKDVLSRYYYAAKENNADVVIRVTSDCPCIDYNILTDMVNVFMQKNEDENIDYLNNTIERTFPRGYDAEIFTFKALEEAFNNAKEEYEREHVTPYLYDVSNGYKIFSYKNAEDYSQYRVTLDTVEDLEVITRIYNDLFTNGEYFSMNEVIKLLKNNPQIVSINRDIEQKKLGE